MRTKHDADTAHHRDEADRRRSDHVDEATTQHPACDEHVRRMMPATVLAGLAMATLGGGALGILPRWPSIAAMVLLATYAVTVVVANAWTHRNDH
ncbi:MAG: hypothetical protein OXC00_03435 [Acidimicrobiaceae bacterium]|nr:hypothetical protein [Acidimicrobiaceae bacterium]